MHRRPLHDRIVVQRLEDSAAHRLPLDVSADGIACSIMKEDDVLADQERSL
jgi:co-chaperonin GroES (HSP10)